jgi:hypothetical protein
MLSDRDTCFRTLEPYEEDVCMLCEKEDTCLFLKPHEMLISTKVGHPREGTRQSVCCKPQ